jgi:hypothetical protein
MKRLTIFLILLLSIFSVNANTVDNTNIEYFHANSNTGQPIIYIPQISPHHTITLYYTISNTQVQTINDYTISDKLQIHIYEPENNVAKIEITNPTNDILYNQYVALPPLYGIFPGFVISADVQNTVIYQTDEILNRNAIEDINIRFPFMIPIILMALQIATFISAGKKGAYFQSTMVVVFVAGGLELIHQGLVVSAFANAYYLIPAFIFLNAMMILKEFYPKE